MTEFSVPTAVAAALAASMVLAAVLTYLSRLRGSHPALGIWAVAYVAYCLRQAGNLAVANGWPELMPVSDGFFVVFWMLLLAGTLRFTRRHVPVAALALGAAAAIGWIFVSYAAGIPFLWQTAPVYLAAGAVMVFTADAFRRQHLAEPGVGHGVVGVVFLVWGIHLLDYPFLRPVPWFAPIGFLITSACTLLIGLSLIVTTQRRQQLVAEEATRWARRSEAELRESEARFRYMADSMPALLYMTDPDGNGLFVNRTWLDYSGRTLAEELGAGWHSTVHPDDLPAMRAQEAAAAAARAPYSFTFRMRRADGVWRTFLDHGVPRIEPDGTFLGYIGTLVDVTEQQTLSAQLQQAQKMEAIGLLTGGVAHDFNNLLAIILGNLDLLDERLPANSPMRSLVRDSLRAAERGAELTGRLLAFARRQPLKPEPVDVNRLVGGMSSLLCRTLGAGIRIDTQLADDIGSVVIDPAQLESALLNLAINARDAMPRGGSLAVRTAAVTVTYENADRYGRLRPGDYVEISVSDSGTGMPSEIASRAFEPFFTTKRAGQGSGLGLSMVYGFVTQSGGHAAIDSAPGAGTCIRLLLPRCCNKQMPAAMPMETAAAPAAPANAAAPDGQGESILLVEDDPSVRQLASQLLDQLGYRHMEAPDGPAALDILATGIKVDLLFTDILLPRGMTGIELANRARELRPSLKALYMTGYADNALAHAPANAGIEVLHKPFRKAELAARLRRVLDAPGDTAPPAEPAAARAAMA